MRFKLPYGLLIIALSLTACGGGGGGSASVPSGTGSVPYTPSGSTSGPDIDAQPAKAEVISMTNAVGAAVDSFSTFEGSSEQVALAVQRASLQRDTAPTGGTCNNGVIVNVPDLNGDADSTETRAYYDSACTNLARDTVRQFQPGTGGVTEIVNSTSKQYASGLPQTPTSVRSDVTTYSNATITKNGYPSLTPGYERSSTGFVYIGSTKTLVLDYELIMEPQSGGVNQFCSDNAGYSIVETDTNDGLTYESFGWGSLVSSGKRTVNGDGSVTWSGTHAGTTYSGSAGSIQVATGAANTACPMTAPEFTISAPTKLGSSTLPISATYDDGVLQNLAIANASLAGGVTLNVSTNTQLTPGNPDFITGTLSNGSGPFASFYTDAFGDGALTISVQGTAYQYAITAWHVMKNPAVPASDTRNR